MRTVSQQLKGVCAKRRLGTFGTALLGILATSASLAAGTAAATPKLSLKADGIALPVGTSLDVATELFPSPGVRCTSDEEGVVTTNQRSTDRIALRGVLFRLCQGGSYVSEGPTGNVGSSLALSWTGTARFTKAGKPRLALQRVEPDCSYSVWGLSGSFTTPNDEGLTVLMTPGGVIQDSGSSILCPQFLPLTGDVTAEYFPPGNEAGYFVGTEVTG